MSLSQKSKVSILLPVFNAEKYLDSTLKSALCQTFRNWELVIVDNCSEDRTEEIVREFASRDGRIKYWRNTQNIGFARNYNRCMELSTGEYLILLGSDDLFEPTCLEKFVNILDSNRNVVLVTSAREFIDAESKPLEINRPYEASRLITANEAAERCLLSLTNWIVAPVMYRATSKRSGFDPNLRMFADLDYWLQILEDGDVFYLDEILFKYRRHQGSETSRMNLNFEAFIDVIRMVDRCQEIHKARRPADEGHSLEQIIGERLLADFNHLYLTQGNRFDEIMRPYLEPSTISPKNLDQDADTLRADFHDLRRILFYSLLHASTMRTNAKLLEDHLNEQRRILKDKLKDAVAAHGHAVQERDKASAEIERLSSKLRASRDLEQALTRETEKLREELSIARQEKESSEAAAK